jgi:hypothetical protein
MSHNNTTCRSSSHMALPPMKKFCVLTFQQQKLRPCSSGNSTKSMGKPTSYTIRTCNGEKKHLQKLAACATIKVHTHLVLMKQILKGCSKPLFVVPTDPVMLMVKNLISHTLLCGESLQLQLLQHITEDDKHWF